MTSVISAEHHILTSWQSEMSHSRSTIEVKCPVFQPCPRARARDAPAFRQTLFAFPFTHSYGPERQVCGTPAGQVR